jgi:hypothetical protein
MATTTHKEPAMTTADAIIIADLIANYRAARDEHRKAWERADEAFRRYMHGEVKHGGAARRTEQLAENATTNLYDAQFELTVRGIDSDLIDQHDNTNCAPHYDLAR